MSTTLHCTTRTTTASATPKPTLLTGYDVSSINATHHALSTPTTPTLLSPASPTASRPPTSSTTSALSSPRTASTFSSPRIGHAHAHSTTSLVSMSQASQHLMTRQIRPPKAPLYVPAVLRPTERPRQYCNGVRMRASDGAAGMLLPTQQPITPPSSTENSFDGKDTSGAQQRIRRSTIDVDADYETANKRAMSLSNFFSGEDFEGMGITRVVTDEWREDEDVENVTGVPTRDHWKPDSSSDSCSFAHCDIVFTFLNRRHHCRRCGNIFCSSHSLYTVPLDQHARFHPNGYKERACSSCWRDHSAWQRSRKLRGSRENSERGSGSEGTASGASTPIVTSDGGNDKSNEDRPNQQRRQSVKSVLVGSLPRDWSWSTF